MFRTLLHKYQYNMSKNTQLAIGLLLGMSLFACQNGETAQKGGTSIEVTTDFTDAADFSVDTEVSTISWKATELGTGGHAGQIQLSGGILKVKDNELIGGSVTIDMNSISSTDLEGEWKGKLEGHLKNEDFFSVATHPLASFEIASVKPVDTISGAAYLVTGNLQIKDVTKSIAFPANIRFRNGTLLATSLPFVIDRTEWGVTYRSGLLGTVKDKIIDDEVKISLKVRGLPPQVQ